MYPNGIVVEADGDVVWVESYTRGVAPPQRRRRRAVSPRSPEGHVPDGLKVAANGDLWITTFTSGGIDIVSPDGRRSTSWPSARCRRTARSTARADTSPTAGGRASRPTRTYGGVLWAVELDGAEGLELFRGSIGA